MRPEEELARYDKEKCWPAVYQRLRVESSKKHDFSLKDARKPEFRNRNRYGDVSPYDDTRVHLKRNNIDYINASIVKAEAADRTYLLTQGPLPDTSGHFWLMVWEQGSRAVLMLNRVIEKDQIKCHQYYPTGLCNQGVDEMVFNDVGLKVTFVSEQHANYHYTARLLQLHDLQSSETRDITQFHYTAWPDFGVPESPDAFLEFLFAVRKSGALDNPSEPPVIHCSAGIGRSGTFCLVDTCLVLIERQGGTDNVNVFDVLMDMRRYRMGLIQTSDQLRFSYLAIVHGTTRVGCTTAIERTASASNNASLNNSSEPPLFDNWLSSSEIEEHSESEEGTTEEEEELPGVPPPPVPPRNVPPTSPVLEREQYLNGHSAPPDTIDQYYANDRSNEATAAAAEQSKKRLNNDDQKKIDVAASVDDMSYKAIAAATAVNEERINNDTQADNEKDLEQSRKNKEEELEIRRRRRDERVKKTSEQIARMRRKQQESELRRQHEYTPYMYVAIVVGLVAIGGALLYRVL